jgi:hypothetical protein
MLPQILVVNPMAKRRRRNPMPAALKRYWAKKHHGGHHHRRAHNPFRRHHRRHHNPFSMRGVTGAVVPAGIGALGGIGLDVGLAYLPVPAALQTGWGNYLVKIAGSFGLGYLTSIVSNRRNGQLVTMGALTVSLYTIIRAMLQQAGVGNSVKGLSGLADFKDYSVGAYMQPGMAGVGRLGAYMNPGANLQTARQLSGVRLGAYMGPRTMGVQRGAMASGY